MITLTKYGANYNRNISNIDGLSTETKPVDTFTEKGTSTSISIQNGSVYTEIDTGKRFMYDREGKRWYEMSSGGTKDYESLINKPSINGVTLDGELSLSDIGLTNPLVIKGRVDTKSQLPVIADAGWIYLVGYSSDIYLEEYVCTTEGKWEKLGDTDIQLDDYIKGTYMTEAEYDALETKDSDTYYFLAES